MVGVAETEVDEDEEMVEVEVVVGSDALLVVDTTEEEEDDDEDEDERLCDDREALVLTLDLLDEPEVAVAFLELVLVDVADDTVVVEEVSAILSASNDMYGYCFGRRWGG